MARDLLHRRRPHPPDGRLACTRSATPEGARAENTPTSVRGAAGILWDSFVTFFQKRDVWKMVAFAFLFRFSIGMLEKIGPFFMVDSPAKGRTRPVQREPRHHLRHLGPDRGAASAPCWAACSSPGAA
ncbi:hypothetical protein [Massilia phosphatilytica]